MQNEVPGRSKADSSLTFVTAGCVRALTILKSLCTTYMAIPSCASCFTSYGVINPTIGLAVCSHTVSDINYVSPNFFVEFTCKSLGYSQRTSLWEQAAVMVIANLDGTAILTVSEKLENNK